MAPGGRTLSLFIDVIRVFSSCVTVLWDHSMRYQFHKFTFKRNALCYCRNISHRSGLCWPNSSFCVFLRSLQPMLQPAWPITTKANPIFFHIPCSHCRTKQTQQALGGGWSRFRPYTEVQRKLELPGEQTPSATPRLSSHFPPLALSPFLPPGAARPPVVGNYGAKGAPSPLSTADDKNGAVQARWRQVRLTRGSGGAVTAIGSGESGR